MQKRISKLKIKYAIFFLLVLSINLGLSFSVAQAAVKSQTSLTDQQNNTASPVNLFAWISYWDFQNWQSEAGFLGNALDGISVFASYFNSADDLLLPEETKALMADVRSKNLSGSSVSLTFVNDIVKEDNSSSLKDIELLKRLFSQKARTQAHIEQIIELTRASGATGIDIDYEAIQDITPLWKGYVSFIKKLSKRAAEEALPVRIILEPKALGKVNFPKGPQYVIMCYNLYGTHSSPGPKASPEFIKKMVAESKSLPGEVTLAFATGGFDWSENGSIWQLSEKDALALRDKYGATPVRDEISGDVVFKYADETGLTHEVWYADGETILLWINTGRAEGINNFALWLIGGNSESSLTSIAAGLL